MGELIKFLTPFEAHTDKLQGQEYPTLPCATLAFNKLLEHCCPDEADSGILRAIRQEAYRFLCEKVIITMDHKIATFLWPRTKDFKAYTGIEREEVRLINMMTITWLFLFEFFAILLMAHASCSRRCMLL